ncbi:MAG TPA: type II toxin-antitoxin system RelE/ParE family toxin [Pyrinomonadaceae bacterium]|nr:type II toxin-antitoxin system RelE/ParE family toxin [Pyrinomonadaceae bacterium]
MDFIATPTFSRKRKKLLTDAEFALFQTDIASNPERGAVIVGTRGLRKIRVRREGGGKSGGFRLIYFWIVSRDTILLLDLYAKSDKADLLESEKKRLAGVRDDYLENLR